MSEVQSTDCCFVQRIYLTYTFLSVYSVITTSCPSIIAVVPYLATSIQ